MKFFKKAEGCTIFDHKRNEVNLEEMKVEPADEKPRRYKSDWLRHVIRTNSNRMPKIILNCRPNGWRRLGRPLKRLLRRGRNRCVHHLACLNLKLDASGVSETPVSACRNGVIFQETHSPNLSLLVGPRRRYCTAWFICQTSLSCKLSVVGLYGSCVTDSAIPPWWIRWLSLLSMCQHIPVPFSCFHSRMSVRFEADVPLPEEKV